VYLEAYVLNTLSTGSGLPLRLADRERAGQPSRTTRQHDETTLKLDDASAA